MNVTAIIVAGGKGTRMGAGINKVFLKLLGKEIILRTINVFDNNRYISDIIVVTDDCKKCAEIVGGEKHKKKISIVPGGKTRQRSVYNGLKAADSEWAVIHDGARALITDKELTDVITNAMTYGAAALGVKVKDTLKIADKDNFIAGTIDRECTYQIQTPQVFKRDLIIEAHMKAIREQFEATDDCALAERYGGRIKIISGNYENIKITTPEDLIIAENILRSPLKTSAAR